MNITIYKISNLQAEHFSLTKIVLSLTILQSSLSRESKVTLLVLSGSQNHALAWVD